MDGGEEAVEEVQIIEHDQAEDDIDVDAGKLCCSKVAGRQPELFLWPKDLLKPDLQLNLVVDEQVVNMVMQMETINLMNLF